MPGAGSPADAERRSLTSVISMCLAYGLPFLYKAQCTTNDFSALKLEVLRWLKTTTSHLAKMNSF